MDRRRGTKRPQPDEPEAGLLWGRIVLSLQELAGTQTNQRTSNVIETVNRSMSKVHTEEVLHRLGPDKLVKVNKKLHQGFGHIKQFADDEERITTRALEEISVLKALKTAPQEISTHEQRRKRQRLSPATAGSTRSTPYATPPLGHSSRLGSGSQQIKLKSKKDNIAAQLPLPPGRRVAFRQPKSKSPEISFKPAHRAKATETPEPEVDDEGDTWIIAEVIRQSKRDKSVYVVKDAEPEEGTEPPQYTTTIKSLIPLPDPEAPLGSPAHPGSYGPYAPNSIVLGLYPDTTAFYRATVVSGPRAGANREEHVYRLKFEGDNDAVQEVAIHNVIPYAGSP